MRKLRPSRIIAIASVAFLVFLAAIYLYFEIQFNSVINRLFEHQANILYQTDHVILANEARSLAKHRQEQQRSARSDMPIKVLEQGDPDIPACLAILKPRSIQIFNDFIKLEFGGALWHYGIVVYNVGLEGPGTKKLADGVWFYSETGRYPGQNGEKKKGPPSG